MVDKQFNVQPFSGRFVDTKPEEEETGEEGNPQMIKGKTGKKMKRD